MEKKIYPRQISIYFSADLSAKIESWTKARPHMKISHLVREALFQYFEKEKSNVGFADNNPM